MLTILPRKRTTPGMLLSSTLIVIGHCFRLTLTNHTLEKEIAVHNAKVLHTTLPTAIGRPLQCPADEASTLHSKGSPPQGATIVKKFGRQGVCPHHLHRTGTSIFTIGTVTSQHLQDPSPGVIIGYVPTQSLDPPYRAPPPASQPSPGLLGGALVTAALGQTEVDGRDGSSGCYRFLVQEDCNRLHEFFFVYIEHASSRGGSLNCLSKSLLPLMQSLPPHRHFAMLATLYPHGPCPRA